MAEATQPSRPASDRKWVVGLIGAIGAGKSTVAGRLEELGAVIIDGDKVGYEVLAEPAVVKQLVDQFGSAILDASGAIDRRILGRIVFADPARRRQLEAIMHPMMRRRFEERVARAQSRADVPLIVLDAAILLEAGWNELCDTIVFVDADPATRRRRVAQARGWSAEDLASRENAQWPLESKRNRANVILTNEGSQDQCRDRVDQLFQTWLGRSVPPR
jgi:dephospho-CoA kinase